MDIQHLLATYERELPRLLTHTGKYVLIHGTTIAGFWETYEDALRQGYERFGLEQFLVKRIDRAARFKERSGASKDVEAS